MVPACRLSCGCSQGWLEWQGAGTSGTWSGISVFLCSLRTSPHGLICASLQHSDLRMVRLLAQQLQHKCSSEPGRSCIGFYDLAWNSHCITSFLLCWPTNHYFWTRFKVKTIEPTSCWQKVQRIGKHVLKPLGVSSLGAETLLCSLLYPWYLKQHPEHRECPINMYWMNETVKNVLKFKPLKYSYPHSYPQS